MWEKCHFWPCFGSKYWTYLCTDFEQMRLWRAPYMLVADVTPLPCLFIRQTILNNCHVIASGIVTDGTPPFLCSECDFSLRYLPSESAYKISSCIVSVAGTVLDVRRGCFLGCVLSTEMGCSETKFQHVIRWKKIKVFFTYVHHGEPKSSVQFHRTTSVSRRAVTAVFTLGYFTSDFPANLRLFLPKTAHQMVNFLELLHSFQFPGCRHPQSFRLRRLFTTSVSGGGQISAFLP